MKKSYLLVLLGIFGALQLSPIIPLSAQETSPTPSPSPSPLPSPSPTATPTPITSPTVTPTPSPSPTPGEPSSTPTSTIDETLKALEKDLQQKNWKAADQKTYELMLRVAGSKSEAQGRFNINEWNNFSCADLKRIDDLWSQASDAKLGFSAQRKLFDRAGKNPNRYYDAIKWKKQDSNQWYVLWEYNKKQKTAEYIPKKQPNFTNPPEGHLPAKLEWEGTPSIDRRFEKIYACEL